MAESTNTPEDTEFSQRILTISTVQFLIQIRDCDVKQTILYLRCTVWISKRRQMVEKGLPWQRRRQFWKIKFKVISAVLLSWRGIKTLILLNFSSAHATKFHLLLFFKLRDLQPSKKAFHTHEGNPSFCHIGGRIVLENRFHAKNIISCDIPK